MLDINKVELSIGDYVLVAFNASGYQNLLYAIITNIEGDIMKVRFCDNGTIGYKTRTLNHYWKYKILKIKGSG